MLILFRKRTPVGSLAVGQVAVVQGKVEPVIEMMMPGIGERCVWYDLMVESFGQGARGAGRPMWLPSRTETKFAGFVLDDGAGKVMIAAGSSEVRVSGGRKMRGPFDRSGRQRFEASLFGAGDTVRVCGVVREARKKGEQKGMLVIGPDGKKGLEIRVR